MSKLDQINPQYSITVKDKKLGLIGYLVIDQLVDGASCGGIRMAENVSIEEIIRLSKEMTMKFAFLNVGYGGAKAGVIAPKNMSRYQREQIFFAFGRSIGPLIRNGSYITGEDLGTSYEDLVHVFRGSGKRLNSKCLETRSSGYYTALTVYLTIKVLAKRKGLDLADCTLAIEGFGKVGKSFVKIASDASMKIVAVSTIKGGIYNPGGLDVGRLIRLEKEYGDDCVNRYYEGKQLVKEDLLTLDVDVLVPCAEADAINIDNVESIKAKLIIPGANIPFSQDAEKILMKKNILFTPGYVSNCGGVLSGILKSKGFSEQKIERILRKHFSKKIDALWKRCRKQKIFLLDAASSVSHENFVRMLEMRGHGKTKKIFLLLKNWKKGGLRELISIVLLHICKERGKYKLGFCRKYFYEMYINCKHFGA